MSLPLLHRANMASDPATSLARLRQSTEKTTEAAVLERSLLVTPSRSRTPAGDSSMNTPHRSRQLTAAGSPKSLNKSAAGAASPQQSTRVIDEVPYALGGGGGGCHQALLGLKGTERSKTVAKHTHDRLLEVARSSVIDRRREGAGKELNYILRHVFEHSEDNDQLLQFKPGKGTPSVMTPTVEQLIEMMHEERLQRAHALVGGGSTDAIGSSATKPKTKATVSSTEAAMMVEESTGRQFQWLIQELGRAKEHSEVVEEQYSRLLAEFTTAVEAKWQAETKRDEALVATKDALELLTTDRTTLEKVVSDQRSQIVSLREKLFRTLEDHALSKAPLGGGGGGTTKIKPMVTKKTNNTSTPATSAQPSSTGGGGASLGGAGGEPAAEGGEEDEEAAMLDEKESLLRRIIDLNNEVETLKKERDRFSDQVGSAQTNAAKARKDAMIIKRSGEAELATYKQMLSTMRDAHVKQVEELELQLSRSVLQLQSHEDAVEELLAELREAGNRLQSVQNLLLAGPSVQLLLCHATTVGGDSEQVGAEINQLSSAISTFSQKWMDAGRVVSVDELANQFGKRKKKEQRDQQARSAEASKNVSRKVSVRSEGGSSSVHEGDGGGDDDDASRGNSKNNTNGGHLSPKRSMNGGASTSTSDGASSSGLTLKVPSATGGGSSKRPSVMKPTAASTATPNVDPDIEGGTIPGVTFAPSTAGSASATPKASQHSTPLTPTLQSTPPPEESMLPAGENDEPQQQRRESDGSKHSTPDSDSQDGTSSDRRGSSEAASRRTSSQQQAPAAPSMASVEIQCELLLGSQPPPSKPTLPSWMNRQPSKVDPPAMCVQETQTEPMEDATAAEAVVSHPSPALPFSKPHGVGGSGAGGKKAETSKPHAVEPAKAAAAAAGKPKPDPKKKAGTEKPGTPAAGTKKGDATVSQEPKAVAEDIPKAVVVESPVALKPVTPPAVPAVSGLDTPATTRPPSTASGTGTLESRPPSAPEGAGDDVVSPGRRAPAIVIRRTNPSPVAPTSPATETLAPSSTTIPSVPAAPTIVIPTIAPIELPSPLSLLKSPGLTSTSSNPPGTGVTTTSFALPSSSAVDFQHMKEMETLQGHQRALMERMQNAESLNRKNQEVIVSLQSELTAAKQLQTTSTEKIKKLETDIASVRKALDVSQSHYERQLKHARQLEETVLEDTEKHTIEVAALNQEMTRLRGELKALSTSELRTQLVQKEKALTTGMDQLMNCASSCQVTASCPHCLETIHDPIVLVPCGHMMCESCFRGINKQRGINVDIAIPALSILGGPSSTAVVPASMPGVTTRKAIPGGAGATAFIGPNVVIGMDGGPNVPPIPSTRPIFTAYLEVPASEDTEYLNRKFQDPASRAHMSLNNFGVVALSANETKGSKTVRTVNCFCEDCQGFTVLTAVRVKRTMEMLDKMGFVVNVVDQVRHFISMVALTMPPDSDLNAAGSGGNYTHKPSKVRLVRSLNETRGAFGADLDVDAGTFVFDD